MDNLGEEWSFLDIISILSFIIGLQNLELNEKQAKALNDHLKEQDEKQLALIIKQNEEIINQNEGIIKLLEENKNGK